MAYIGQDKKRTIAAELKTALRGSGLKYTLGIGNNSTLTVKFTEGPIDFLKNFNETAVAMDWGQGAHLAETYLRVNEYHYESQYTGEALKMLKKIMPILNRGNFDHSDPQTDYFSVGWYVSINIGTWGKPYKVTPFSKFTMTPWGSVTPGAVRLSLMNRELALRSTMNSLIHVVDELYPDDPSTIENLNIDWILSGARDVLKNLTAGDEETYYKRLNWRNKKAVKRIRDKGDLVKDKTISRQAGVGDVRTSAKNKQAWETFLTD